VLAELKSKGSMRARSTSLRKQAIVELISHWKMPCTVHRSRTIGIGIQSYEVEQMSGLLSSFLDSVWSVTKTMDLRPWLTHAVSLALRVFPLCRLCVMAFKKIRPWLIAKLGETKD
jgi:hypothetical protein